MAAITISLPDKAGRSYVTERHIINGQIHIVEYGPVNNEVDYEEIADIRFVQLQETLVAEQTEASDRKQAEIAIDAVLTKAVTDGILSAAILEKANYQKPLT